MPLPKNTAHSVNIQYDTDRSMDIYYQLHKFGNEHVFEGRLPTPQILPKTLSKNHCLFVGQFIDHISGLPYDRIHINQRGALHDSFAFRIVSFLDAMVSQEQYHYGVPSCRTSYRNKERADLSKRIGLIPSSTGGEGGKETGEGIKFYMQDGGAIDKLIQYLLSLGYEATWQERTPEPKKKDSGGKRINYICPISECKKNYQSGIDVFWECPEHKILSVVRE